MDDGVVTLTVRRLQAGRCPTNCWSASGCRDYTERNGRSDDPLFPTRTGRRLSRDAIALRINTHAATAASRCPSLQGKRLHPHVLRHTCAMSLLQAGVDTSVIALWLGHVGVRSTDAYLHADMNIKEKALAPTTPQRAPPGRYHPTDQVLAFLESL
ncbi:tyrosine-type recombinase/integrase [Nonomuraea sp. NPDC049028]|uniref:tyrosine-type recombinase/integrase n=1 Tax=Nonomuraea sp. NPDC049028 TaxID=3364348 RepID=UPI003715867D